MAGGGGPAERRTLAYGALALAAVLFLSVIVLSESAIRNIRLDLTEESLFTLSDGTVKTLSSLDEPITLRLFATRKLVETSGLTAYAARVQELLERYASLSGGSVRLEVVDPEPFSPEDDRAAGFRLTGVPISQAGDIGYFGIAATNSTDDVDVIPFLAPQRERFLEYDLTRMIHNLGNPKKRVIALVSGIPLDSDPLNEYRPWTVVENLRQFFEVRAQGLSPKLGDDVDLAMIVHPFGLSAESRYQIDQFVLRGGKAIVFVDPHAEEGARSNAALRLPPGVGSDLPGLLEAWGLRYDKDKVLGDMQAGTEVQAGTDSFGRPIITRYVAWVRYGPGNIQTGDVVASDLDSLNLATAGFLETRDGATTEVEPLVWSTRSAGPIDADSVRRNPQPHEILKAFKPQDRSYTIAARVSGKARSAFPDGPPEAGGEKEGGADGGDRPEPRPHVAESADGINVIVFADTDLLADRSWLRIQDLFGQRLVVPNADNGDLVVNAADNMAGSGDLISLRGRGLSNRPFEVVERIRRQAEDRYRAQERALRAEVEETERRLRALRTTERAERGEEVMSPEQKREVAKFQARLVEIRKELRDVQLNLRRDIDRLGADLKLVNIAAVPTAVAVLAVALYLAQRRRTRARGGRDGA